MIHLCVASPMGIDSLLFSFIEQLVAQNGHICIDPPAEQLDDIEPMKWIEPMRRSEKHHFVIGYRYPPLYWSQILALSSTVVVPADWDGIARQIEDICSQQPKKAGTMEIEKAAKAIWPALDNMVDIIDILHNDKRQDQLLPPTITFSVDPAASFRRVECFYQDASVPLAYSCWKEFSEQVSPILNNMRPPSRHALTSIHRLLSLEKSMPTSVKLLEVHLGQNGSLSYLQLRNSTLLKSSEWSLFRNFLALTFQTFELRINS